MPERRWYDPGGGQADVVGLGRSLVAVFAAGGVGSFCQN
jgi:hypothetical protein